MGVLDICIDAWNFELTNLASKQPQPIVIISHRPNGAAFRYRIQPLVELLTEKGLPCTVIPLVKKNYGLRFLAYKKLIEQAPFVLLHKVRMPRLEAAFLFSLNRHFYFDIDDAIYMQQPKYVGHVRRPSWVRKRNFEYMAQQCRTVIVGNEFLAKKVIEAKGKPQQAPTGIDVQNYQARALDANSFRAVWVGMPANIRYLDAIRPALVKVAEQEPRFKLVVISSEFPDWDDVPIEKVVWSLNGEKAEIARADMGLMPLAHDEYSEAKCAFKLLQYMAAGIACIGSPVGANCDVVEQGQSGFLADSLEQWRDSILTLLNDEGLRQAMGQRGRELAEEHYDTRKIAQNTLAFLEEDSKR
ncbi:glycosyltransferase family 4 protein [Agaribacterium sp. ZY112]|uniref:glycosyltransferase family 4 protein n=1 Tax=Agaribacterium sp. ZY112 TaxID=3233574 RepID=UPI0035260D50